MNSNKTLLILAILLICLGAYVYYVNPVSLETPSEPEKALDFQTEDVREVLLKKRDQVLLFRKRDGKWMIGGRQVARVGQAMINGLLSTFDLGIVGVVESSPSDLAQYGLDHPEVEFGIKAKEDAGFRRLLLGSNSPTNNACYAKKNEGQDVMLLGILYKENMVNLLSKLRLKPTS